MKKKNGFSFQQQCTVFYEMGQPTIPINLASIPNMDTSLFEFQPAVKYTEESNLNSITKTTSSILFAQQY